MHNDHIVEEVRRARQQIFEECGRDFDRLIERLQAAEAKHKDRLVTIEQVRQRARGSAKRG